MNNLILERLHSHVYTLFSVTLLFIETVLLELTYFDAKHFIYHQNSHLWLWDKGELCILTYRLTNSGGRTLRSNIILGHNSVPVLSIFQEFSHISISFYLVIYGLFYHALSISDCITWGDRITDGWKGFGRKWLCLINIIFWNFPGGHEKSNKIIQNNQYLGCNSNWKTVWYSQSVKIHVNVILRLLNVLSDCYLHT